MYFCIFLIIYISHNTKWCVDKFRMVWPHQIMIGKNIYFCTSNFLNRIKTRPIWCMEYTLSMKKVTKVWTIRQIQNLIFHNIITVKHLNLFNTIIKFCYCTTHIKILFIFFIFISMIPGRYKIHHKYYPLYKWLI